LDFAKGVPGQVDDGDFERWSQELRNVAGISLTSLRKYQSAVRTYFKFIVESPRYRNLIRSELGLDVVQVVTPENSIPHRNEREMDSLRRPVSLVEQQRFFSTIDEEIAYASAGSKSLHVLRRDKAMFYIAFKLGLRAMEISNLNLSCFTSDDRLPDLKEFAVVHVFGKGEKWRAVPVADPLLPETMAWYLESVRPALEKRARPGEQAVFLTERGARITYSAIYSRFRHICFLANVDGVSPHSMRHTTASEDIQSGVSIHAEQQKLGHAHASTTDGYAYYPKEFTRREFDAALKRRLAKIKEDGENT
jgi:site-specific recombinase XerD